MATPTRSLDDGRIWQTWDDLSLRAKFLLFAIALIVVPGSVFAVVAFSGARAAIEREVGIQLHQIAEQGASAVGVAIDRARRDARSWASQDLMRDLVVGDLDKRVSRFLATIGAGNPAYRVVLCVDAQGRTVAASSGEWLGRDAGALVSPVLLDGREIVSGPQRAAGLPGEVLTIAVPIPDPDRPGQRIGGLVLVYDWEAVGALLDDIRGRLRDLGKRVEGFLLDASGRVIAPSVAQGGDLRAAVGDRIWQPPAGIGFGTELLPVPAEGNVELLVGSAPVADRALRWSVMFAEPTREALAQVSTVRRRWIVMMISILIVGMVTAVWLARQVLSPLDEVARATANLVSHLDRELPLLPVRSRNEVGQLAESFNKMTIELKRSQEETLHAAKFAFAGELAALVAHEVRTPLSVMRSSAQMLAEPAERRAGENAELVATIVSEVDRIDRVVTALLELARPLEKRVAPVRLGELLARAADFVAPRADKLGLRIERATGGVETRALCDSEQIYQVVLNLLVNSLQALGAGGKIWLRMLAPDDAMVGFEIGDDGPGIPEDLRGRLFLPFVTGREEGTGLGLAFVDRVVKAHGGRVVLRSAPGQGTMFEIWLPAAGRET
jgi:signal transduction histidine kinase